MLLYSYYRWRNSMGRNFKNIARLIDSANKLTTPEQDFLADLKRSIELNEDKNRRKPSQTYKPSSMHCIRNMYYQVSGIEQDSSDKSYCLIGICNSGTDIHVRIQTAVDKMKDNGIDCEYIDVAKFIKDRNLSDNIDIVEKSGMETKLYHKYFNMSFLCDGIIKYKGHYYILEIKTESSYKWLNRKGVDEDHYHQGISYSIVFNIPEVLFLYVNRDNLDMKAYMFTPTEEQKYDLIGLIETCDDYVKQNKVPPKPENLSKNICSYCNYKSTCNKDN